jgi:hypothetical protein
MAMVKKSNRQIPSMVITVRGEGQADIEALCENETFINAVFVETIAGIKDAINTKSKIATLFQIAKSEYYLELEKSQWKQALQTCIDRFIEEEKYEECSKIKVLIDKIK